MINFAQDVLGYKMMTSVYMCAHRLLLGSKSLAERERRLINCYCTFDKATAFEAAPPPWGVGTLWRKKPNRTFGKATAFAAAPPPWGVGTFWRRRSSFCRTSSCGTIGSNYVCYLLNECVYTVTTRYRYTSQTVAQCTLPGQPNNQLLSVQHHSLTYVPAVFWSVPRCLESLPLSAEQLSLWPPTLHSAWSLSEHLLCNITVIPTELNTWRLWISTFFPWITSSFSRRVLSFSRRVVSFSNYIETKVLPLTKRLPV